MKSLHLNYRVLLIAAIIASLTGSNVVFAKAASAADISANPMPGCDQYLLFERETRCGVISKDGKILIEPKYRTIDYVGDDLFATWSGNEAEPGDARFLVDAGGRIVTSLPDWAFTDRCKLKEGILHIGNGSACGIYLNQKGQFIVEDGRFELGQDFSCGFAAVQYRDRAGWEGAYINKRGKVAIGPFRNAECSSFSRGMAVIKLICNGGETKCGLISTRGKFVVPPVYDSICEIEAGQQTQNIPANNIFHFYRGFVLIKYPPHVIGITIPRRIKSDTLLPCRIVYARELVDSHSHIWGYIDLSGKIVIPAKFDSCGEFSGDSAPASILDEGNMPVDGRINRQGQWISQASPGPQDSFEKITSNREYFFYELLKSHDLIGMPVADLEKHIGEGVLSPEALLPAAGRSVISYNLRPTATCGNMARLLDIALDEHQKVAGWSIRGFGEPDVWITENVVLINPDYCYPGNLIPRAESKLAGELK